MNTMYVIILYSVTIKEEYIGVGRVLRYFFLFSFFKSVMILRDEVQFERNNDNSQ